MRAIRTSGLMSGDGKRGGAQASVLAPILDSTSLCGAAGWNPKERVSGSNIILDNRRPGGEAARVSGSRFWRLWVADKLCLVSLAEALSPAVPDTDCRVIL